MHRRTFLQLVSTGVAPSLYPAGYLQLISTPVTATGTPKALRRASPESQGIPSASVLAFIEEVESENHSLHSLMIARNSYVIAEGWWAPYSPKQRHMLYSLSKPFTTTAIGIAQSEGRLNLDDTVVSFFPDESPENPSVNLKAMTVRDLLRMTSGHGRGKDNKVISPQELSWVKSFLEVDVINEPGTHWGYSNTDSYILSAVIQKVTGERLLDYLRPRLFEPLGVIDPVWHESPEGVTLGGVGLRLTTEDILRFGDKRQVFFPDSDN